MLRRLAPSQQASLSVATAASAILRASCRAQSATAAGAKKHEHVDDPAFERGYQNEKHSPREGRGMMGDKSRKLADGAESLVSQRDGVGVAGKFNRATAFAAERAASASRSGAAPARDFVKDPLSADELTAGAYLSSESPAPRHLDTSNNVPGDTMGTYETRQPFLRPLHRNVVGTVDNVQFAELMPSGADPMRCVAPEMLRRLAAKYAMSHREVLHLMIDCQHDVNAFLHHCERRLGKKVRPGDYGLVAVESYDPECFCLANFCMPSYESTKEEDRLEALHELTLSAAEIPLDTPRDLVVHRFRNGWTTDGDEDCRALLEHLDVSVRDIVLLPFGEYSSQGFYVACPSLPGAFPNIGTGAAAVCYDLRSGIHARFRFHTERNADSLAEHLVREQMHFDQRTVHFLRQSFWFNPDFSVEDFIRYKESLLMPSATVYELRAAVMLHNLGGRPAYRNVAEVEKLKIAQHKLDKGGREQAMAGALFDSTGQSKVMGAAKQIGDRAHYRNDSKERDNSKEVTLENLIFDQAEVRVHAERIWEKFYRNNFY